MSDPNRPDTDGNNRPDDREMSEPTVEITEYATVSEIAEAEDVTKRTVRRWCEDERVTAQKDDTGTWRIDLSTVPPDRTEDTASGLSVREDTSSNLPGLIERLIQERTELERENERLRQQSEPRFNSSILSILDWILP